MGTQLLWIGAISWFAAQSSKLVLTYFATGQFQFSLLWSSGGMPSAHASLVSSLSAGLFRYQGLESPVFQVMLFMSLIVMHDAMGVRRQAGEHAKALNSLAHREGGFGPLKRDEDGKVIQIYKEMIGHTPLQVISGAILGLLIGLYLPPF